MNVDKHISELLYDHDCVIVPDLGGFVANYAPATIHPVQHSFGPPRKRIVFNKSLKNNDGLLANQISTSEETTYPQALQHIRFFVDNTHEQLKRGAKVKISEVGTLFLDVEKNIQFEPDNSVNHLTDAFGLSSFQSPAIRRDNGIRRIEKELRDRSAIPAKKERRINVKRAVALTVIVPVLAAMVWIPLKTDLLKGFDYASLNPFRNTTNHTADIPKKAVVVTPVPSDSVVAADATNTAAADTSVSAAVANVPADSTAVSTSPVQMPDGGFHVVAGCFQIRENADNFVNTLQQQSLSAKIIGQNENGLYVVSCGDFANRTEAASALQEVRRQQPNAWLYRN